MSKHRLMVMAAGGLAMALVAAPIGALHSQVTAPGTNPRTPTTGPVTTSQVQADIRADLPFMQEAASANLMEVQLGQLAQQRAVTPAVKQFGQRMVNDHTNLQTQLTNTASQNGVSFTPSLSSDHQKQISQLQSINALQFDRAYMTAMIQDHQNDVAKFQSQSGAAHSAPVQTLIARALPVLQQHLDLARQVGSQLGVQVATTPTQPTNTPTTTPPVVTTPPVTTTPPVVTQPNVPNQNAPVTAAQRADIKKDEKFVDEIAQDNMLEARLAQLAIDKAQNSAVKQFAERENSDHTRIQDDWSAMTANAGLPVQHGIGKKHRQKLDKLQKLSGRAFDKAYMTMEVQNHKDYIDYLEKEGRASNSGVVRNLVDRTLPIFMQHFNNAKRTGGQVGAETDVTLRSERSKK